MNPNRFQQAMPPGSPEARRSYCTCPTAAQTEWVQSQYPNDEVSPIDFDCPLHGDDPKYQLPPSI